MSKELFVGSGDGHRKRGFPMEWALILLKRQGGIVADVGFQEMRECGNDAGRITENMQE